jgi:thiosulfate/3-mercaptopyruvate sulfurtransferase
MYRTLLSTDDLAAHLGDAEWAVIDCRSDLANESWGQEQYRASHIPGAVYASLSHDLAGPKTGTNGRHPLPSAESMRAIFGRWGIAPATQVVVYDQDTGMFAARLWWMLRYMEHDAVSVLDGGFAKWTREGRPTRAGDEQRPAATFSGTPREAMRQTVEQLQQPGTSRILVDARAPERYEGRNEPLDRVPGHIPGARNYFFKQNLSSEGTMLPPEQLRAQLSGVLGGTPANEATMYCGSGVTACHNLLALEHAGMPGAKLYVGSWSEWSSDPSRPVATGSEETERRDSETQRK